MEKKVEDFLLEELMEKKEELNKVKKEKEEYTSALDMFRNVLVEVVKRINVVEVTDSTAKEMNFGPITNEKDKNLFDTLEKFAKDLGVIKNEQ